MPRINPNSAARVAWRSRNAGIVSWLQSYSGTDRFVTSIAASLASYGSLTDPQLRAVTQAMERIQNAPVRAENAADRAAGPEHCPHIYNGVYTLDDGNEHLTFQIYTVTRGSLIGKRIVKRQLEYGQFQGFAFVGQDGTLQLWRRFADQATELYVEWAKILLEQLNQRANAVEGADTIHFELHAHDWTINRSRACRRCNRALTVPTSIEQGIGPECANRMADSRTTVADPHVVGVNSNGVPRRVRRPQQSHQALHDTGECFCNDPTGRLAQEQAAADERSRRLEAIEARRIAAERAAQPQQSELGTGMIQ